jgi:Zn finger protein HypA/HybF involved in hydrogenase expression
MDEGRVVVVTGGGGAIGTAVRRRFAAAGDRPVDTVRVRVAGTIPSELVRQGFAMLTTGTVLESASLDIEPYDVRLRCECGFVGALEHDDMLGPSLAICPQCDSLQRIASVPELELLDVHPRASGPVPITA